ncbi:PREDICTED: ovarian cancer-associated gene 2 protein, partial [Cariama cristata]|uniref:ovarian cancer-associated gene 2 protein n=1 Tax=Cariama cristata TaxID=54380 RepID=UPI000520799E
LRARGDPRFPVAFAILVAGFASRAPAHSHFYREPIALPTLHVVGNTDAVIAAHLSRELAQHFVEPVVLTHPGGHFIPAAAPQKRAYLDFLGRFRPGEGQSRSVPVPLFLGRNHPGRLLAEVSLETRLTKVFPPCTQ